ncbi:hypothetical protein QE177_04470 [Arsenophonus sp. aPb]|uniref:hypothetical protein n=1 Tax=Arsenophonus sp. aPb TaxID=3041619 RepID=UPI0024688B4B|nr:hypothetical protein [Arsenophonus sp. aPb]WGL99140.1 hypothetical protein QE177_04470 [Arsenophonus sp. aPb]
MKNSILLILIFVFSNNIVSCPNGYTKHNINGIICINNKDPNITAKPLCLDKKTQDIITCDQINPYEELNDIFSRKNIQLFNLVYIFNNGCFD